MAYWSMAALVTLSAVALIWLLATGVVALLATWTRGWIDTLDASRRASLSFRLRVFPLFSAVAGALAVVLPVFLWFEPRDSQERIPITLMVTAAAGAILIGRAIWRTVRSSHDTFTIARRWRREGRPLSVDVPLPVIAVDRSFPAVAVIGFHRPVLFISARVLRECSDEEVRAMIAHECAHVEARDNLKRLALSACPAVGAIGSDLLHVWCSASEEAADLVAATRSPQQALPLAQALVRVARLSTNATPTAAFSAFYERGNINVRVRRLLDPQAPSAPPRSSPVPLAIGALLAGGALLTAAPAIHQMMERTLAMLP